MLTVRWIKGYFQHCLLRYQDRWEWRSQTGCCLHLVVFSGNRNPLDRIDHAHLGCMATKSRDPEGIYSCKTRVWSYHHRKNQTIFSASFFRGTGKTSQLNMTKYYATFNKRTFSLALSHMRFWESLNICVVFCHLVIYIYIYTYLSCCPSKTSHNLGDVAICWIMSLVNILQSKEFTITLKNQNERASALVHICIWMEYS